MSASSYKLVFIAFMSLLCGLLALRIKGRLAGEWMITIARYMVRPRYFVLDKNDPYLRPIMRVDDAQKSQELPTVKVAESDPLHPAISFQELVRLEAVLRDPATNLRFNVDKKGALHVGITQNK